MGSLLWDTSNDRNSWRKNSIDLNQGSSVYLPIRYGRKSRSREYTYTMVFSTKCYLKSYGLGKGWVFPLKNEVDSFDDLRTEAQEMGRAEGFQNGLISSWGSIALKLNPNKTIDMKIKKQWSDLMSTKLEFLQLLTKKLKTERSAIDSGGFLTIRWPDQVKKETNIDSLDFLISTVTLPTLTKRRYPTVHQIATSMNKNNYYNYFFNNRKNNIVTFQDDRILKRIKKKNACND